MTWNLMSAGAVLTPGGEAIPPARLNTTTDGTVNAYPSVSSTIALNAGVNRFGFTGQSWRQHPTGGIDWDLYTISGEPQQAVIGNWGHVWSPSAEASQYQAANGTPFSESQQILRVYGNGSFWTLILPYEKGRRPADLSVIQDPSTNDVAITRVAETVRLNEHYYSYSNGRKVALTAFDTVPVVGNGMAISGGPMEIVLGSGTATVTFHGAPGVRTFSLPGSWTAAGGISGSGSSFTYFYQGQNPTTIVLPRVNPLRRRSHL